MGTKKEKTSLEKAKDLIEKSGNNFHYEVANTLRENGWEVTVSQFYNDAFSQKPREIDLIAEKAFSSDHYSSSNTTVIVRLFIECKYINSTTIFWLDNKNIERAKGVVNKTRAFHDPDKNVLVGQKHHYLSNSKVGKLFSSESNRDRENDPIYKAITQCLNALIYFRGQRTKLYEKQHKRYIEELDYPVIICSSFNDFFSQESSAKNDPQNIPSDFPLQLEIDYAYPDQKSPTEELFYIDVIPLEKLGSFEKMLQDGDVGIATQKLADEGREADYQRMIDGRQDDHIDPFDPYPV